jgi:hypothetical protein
MNRSKNPAPPASSMRTDVSSPACVTLGVVTRKSGLYLMSTSWAAARPLTFGGGTFERTSKLGYQPFIPNYQPVFAFDRIVQEIKSGPLARRRAKALAYRWCSARAPESSSYVRSQVTLAAAACRR